VHNPVSEPNSRPGPIDALPAQTVRRLGALDVDALREWAERAGHRFVLAECADCADKVAVLRAIGRAFAFPDWYGANLDALYDCLTDLPEREVPGWVVVLEGLPGEPRLSTEQLAALLDVFRDAADDFAERGIGLRVFYS
jgi:RNAse (barnase) inhibitor barstar